MVNAAILEEAIRPTVNRLAAYMGAEENAEGALAQWCEELTHAVAHQLRLRRISSDSHDFVEEEIRDLLELVLLRRQEIVPAQGLIEYRKALAIVAKFENGVLAPAPIMTTKPSVCSIMDPGCEACQ